MPIAVISTSFMTIRRFLAAAIDHSINMVFGSQRRNSELEHFQKPTLVCTILPLQSSSVFHFVNYAKTLARRLAEYN